MAQPCGRAAAPVQIATDEARRLAWERDQRRVAIVRAQDMLFDEPCRSPGTDPEPLVYAFSAAA